MSLPRSPLDNEDRQWTPHTLGCNIAKATPLLGSPSVWKESKLEIVPRHAPHVSQDQAASALVLGRVRLQFHAPSASISNSAS